MFPWRFAKKKSNRFFFQVELPNIKVSSKKCVPFRKTTVGVLPPSWTARSQATCRERRGLLSLPTSNGWKLFKKGTSTGCFDKEIHIFTYII